MLKLLAPVFVPRIVSNALELQKSIGYRLSFKNLPREWINGYALADMSKTWSNYNLSVKGLNYFTLGNIKDGLSSRFIPGDRMYQAWLGGYIFTDTQPISWSSKEYLKLAEADQKKWLWRYGIQKSTMNFGDLKRVKDFTVGKFKAELFSWSGATQSDVGDRSRRLYNRATMDGMAYIMNKLTAGLRLKGSNFIPSSSVTRSYEELTIYGCIAIIDIKPNTKSVLYVCMSEQSTEAMQYMEGLITKNIELVVA